MRRRDDGPDRPRPMFARYYTSLSQSMEAQGMGELRRELLAGVEGEVVEVGAGNGLNFVNYPAAVEKLTAVEPEPYLRAQAEAAATSAPTAVDVVAGVADELPLQTGSVDVVVFSLVLCSVPDPASTLREAARVLRPGGQLRYLEHERGDTKALRTVQRMLDATVWPRLGGGCHLGRQPSETIAEVGFVIGPERRFRFPDNWLSAPAAPHVLGSARPITAS